MGSRGGLKRRKLTRPSRNEEEKQRNWKRMVGYLIGVGLLCLIPIRNFVFDDLSFYVISLDDALAKQAALRNLSGSKTTAVASTTSITRETIKNKENSDINDFSLYKLNPSIMLRPNILNKHADSIWDLLLKEGLAIDNPGVAFEVGMHRAKQCREAAQMGYTMHCLEPSPGSFRLVQAAVAKTPQDVQQRINLYNVAAGGESEGTIVFHAAGSTGDHVGTVDMWKMRKKEPAEIKKENEIHVPTKRLDDIVDAAGHVYIMKIDTQGYEPVVFSGLTESLKQHKVDYILFEYWPRGMDLIADKPDQCIGVELLKKLMDYGYTIYTLPVLAHPAAPNSFTVYNNIKVMDRPTNNIADDCHWFYGLEREFPTPDYFMGYWTDMLAVSPKAKLPKNPKTSLGKSLSMAQNST